MARRQNSGQREEAEMAHAMAQQGASSIQQAPDEQLRAPSRRGHHQPGPAGANRGLPVRIVSNQLGLTIPVLMTSRVSQPEIVTSERLKQLFGTPPSTSSPGSARPKIHRLIIPERRENPRRRRFNIFSRASKPKQKPALEQVRAGQAGGGKDPGGRVGLGGHEPTPYERTPTRLLSLRAQSQEERATDESEDVDILG